MKLNDIDILQSINNKAASNDVYNNKGVDLILSSLFGSATGVIITSVALAAASWNGQNYATTVQNQINNKSEKVIT